MLDSAAHLAAASYLVVFLSACTHGKPVGEDDWCAKLKELNVGFFGEDGRRLRIEDLAKHSGSATWEVLTHPPNPQAMSYFNKGRALAMQGDYSHAREAYQKAATLDPSWPYPVHEMAFASLVLGEPSESLRLYKEVDRLAPEGFFTVKTAIDTLTREIEGRLYPGAYLDLLRLEWMTDNSEKKQMLIQMLSLSREFPAAWKAYSQFLEDGRQCLEAIETGLSFSPDPGTRGSLLVYKADALSQLGDESGCQAILQMVVNDPSTIIGSRVQALIRLCLSQLG